MTKKNGQPSFLRRTNEVLTKIHEFSKQDEAGAGVSQPHLMIYLNSQVDIFIFIHKKSVCTE